MKTKRTLSILIMAFVILFTSLGQVHAEEVLTDYYICDNASMSYYTLEGEFAGEFRELRETTVKAREATYKEYKTVEDYVWKEIQEDNARLIANGLNPFFLENRQNPVNQNKNKYYVVEINDKLYLAGINNKSEGFVDLSKENIPVKVERRHEKRTLSGYDAENIYRGGMADLVKGRYLGDKLYKEIDSFSTNKKSEQERFKDVLEKYLSLGLTYNTGGKGEDQFKVLENGKGMCWSMSILFSKFLDKANIPYRFIHEDRYINGKPEPAGHFYLQVLIDGKWLDLETTDIRPNLDAETIMNTNGYILSGSVFTDIQKVYSNQKEIGEKFSYTSSYTYKNGQVIDPRIEKISIYY